MMRSSLLRLMDPCKLGLKVIMVVVPEFAVAMAWRSDPGPLSLRLVTCIDVGIFVRAMEFTMVFSNCLGGGLHNLLK